MRVDRALSTVFEHKLNWELFIHVHVCEGIFFYTYMYGIHLVHNVHLPGRRGYCMTECLSFLMLS